MKLLIPLPTGHLAELSVQRMAMLLNLLPETPQAVSAGLFVSVCLCVYVCVSTSLYLCVPMYVDICFCVNICVYLCTCLCLCVCMSLCVSMCVCVCVCVSVCACMCDWNKMNQEPHGKPVHLPREWIIFLTQNLGKNVKYQNKHRNKIEENTKFMLICI